MPESPRHLLTDAEIDAALADTLLDVGELSRRWGVHPVTVRKWLASDILPHIHLGPGAKPRVRVYLSVAIQFEQGQLRSA